MTEQNPGSYRHELKYLVSNAQVMMLKTRLTGLIPLDAHAGSGGYRIRSLYFDDYDDRCLLENEDGTDPREKYRIRIYNHSADRITLECKRKERGMTRKVSCPLTRGQTEALMEGKPLSNVAQLPPLLGKFTAQMLTDGLKPVVIVEYDRLPFVYRNGNVRITLDTSLSSSSDVRRFLDGEIPRRPVMPTGLQLLEVKYDAFLPDFLYQSLQLPNLRQTAYSKYALCRRFTR
ncbi:MAG: polyphosphate polymerase domain-containing protein [Firmicutes bacterium]|nr:polyphosphate polymerase domain-containing protein [Bacillota bacterium]